MTAVHLNARFLEMLPSSSLILSVDCYILSSSTLLTALTTNVLNIITLYVDVIEVEPHLGFPSLRPDPSSCPSFPGLNSTFF